MKIFSLTCAAVLIGLTISITLIGWVPTLTSERGGAELAGLLVFALATCLSIGKIGLEGLQHWWPIPAVLMLFCLRELDFHDSFFEPGLLHTEIFSSTAPMWQKAVSAGAMVSIFLILIRVVMLGFIPLTRGLLAKKGWAWAIAIGVIVAALSVLIDGDDRQLVAVGIYLPAGYGAHFTALEELFELGFGLSLVVASSIWPSCQSSQMSREALTR